MEKSHNKNQKKNLVPKGNAIAKKFDEKCLIYNKTKHHANDCRNKAWNGNIKNKITSQDNIIKVDHLINRVLKTNFFVCCFEVNLINKHRFSKLKKEKIFVSHKTSIEDFHPNTIMESKNYNSLMIYFHLSKYNKIIHLKKNN